jgi:carbamoyl-phosphate synthase large subunit
VELVRELHRAGCRLYATEGTAAMVSAMGMPVTMTTKKLGEGYPNVIDVVGDGSVGAVINTLSGDTSTLRDGFFIRRAAVERQIPCFTSLDTARAAVESLLMAGTRYSVQCIEEYLNGI